MTWVKKNEVCHEGRPHDQQNLIHESSVLCELLLIEFQERHFRVVACRSGLVLERPEYLTGHPSGNSGGPSWVNYRLLADSYLESV